MRRQKAKIQESYVWLSYSDLATGLMISFIMFYLVNFKKNESNKEFMMQAVKPVSNARDAFNKVNENVVKIVTKKGVCSGAVIKNLKHQPDTIRITFKQDNMSWFAVDSAVIKKFAENCVIGFGQEWLKQMYLENEKHEIKIQNLIIEGHASSDGGYYHNLGLSQERAYETSKFILQHSNANELGLKGSFDSWKRQTLSANGRGESQLVFKVRSPNNQRSERCLLEARSSRDCEEDKENSKRVEFKYTLIHDYKKYEEVRRKLSEH